MSPTIKPRPTVLPTAIPIIVTVSIDLVRIEVSDEEIEGDVEEGVDTSLFPTVDSGRFTACDALIASNLSVVLTSRYAHAGTAVSGLI